MSKKLPTTPRGKIKAAIRALSLRCRERNAALKRDHYTCVKCGAKQSVAKGKEVKVAAHHKHGIQWEKAIDAIIKFVLQTPDDYETMCKKCHDETHETTKNKKADEPNKVRK